MLRPDSDLISKTVTWKNAMESTQSAEFHWHQRTGGSLSLPWVEEALVNLMGNEVPKAQRFPL